MLFPAVPVDFFRGVLLLEAFPLPSFFFARPFDAFFLAGAAGVVFFRADDLRRDVGVAVRSRGPRVAVVDGPPNLLTQRIDMINKTCALVWSALIGATVTAPDLQAQFPTDTLDVRGVMALLHRTSSAAAAARFLRQEAGARALGELDDLADSLVVVARSYRSEAGPAAQRAAHESLAALAGSAMPEAIAEMAAKRAERGLPPPVPYLHAFDKLVEVIHGAEDVGIRGATLWSLTQMGATGRAVAVLSDVAVSDDPIAPTAIRHLNGDTGEAGVSALRQLYETDAVVNPQAREDLEAIASVRGWSR